MVFVVDDIYQDNIQNIKNKELTTLYKEWNEMYIISRYKKFDKSDLIKFKITKKFTSISIILDFLYYITHNIIKHILIWIR